MEKFLIIVCMIGFFSLAVFAGSTSHYDGKHTSLDEVSKVEHSAVYVDRHSTIKVNYPVEKAIRLFSAEGEKYWIPGWKPLILKGDGFNKGDVFVIPASTDHKQSTFIVVEFNKEKGVALYSRVVQGLSAGLIEINVTPSGIGSSVEVTYKITSLSKKGAEELSRLSNEAFAKEMSHWEKSIESHKHFIENWFKKGSE